MEPPKNCSDISDKSVCNNKYVCHWHKDKCKNLKCSYVDDEDLCKKKSCFWDKIKEECRNYEKVKFQCSDLTDKEGCNKKSDCIWDGEKCDKIDETIDYSGTYEKDPRLKYTKEFEKYGFIKDKFAYYKLWDNFLKERKGDLSQLKILDSEFLESIKNKYVKYDYELIKLVINYISSNQQILNEIDDLEDIDANMQNFYNFMREKSELENVSILYTIIFYLKSVKDIKKGILGKLSFFDEETRKMVMKSPTYFYLKLKELYLQKNSQFRLLEIFKQKEDLKKLKDIQYEMKAYIYKTLDKKQKLAKIKDKLSPEFWNLLNTKSLNDVKEYIYGLLKKKTISLKNPYFSNLQRRKMRIINPKLNEILVKNIDECILIHKSKPWLPALERMNAVYFISHPAGLSKEQIPEDEKKFYGSLLSENLYVPTQEFWNLHCIENHNKSCNYENLVLTFTSNNKKFIHGTYNIETKKKYVFTEEDFKKECDWMNKQKDVVLMQNYLNSEITSRHRTIVKDILASYNIHPIEEIIYNKNKTNKLSSYLLDIAKVYILYRKDLPFYNMAEETRNMIADGFYDDMMMFIPLLYVLDEEDRKYMNNLYEVSSKNIMEELAMRLYNKENYKQLRIRPKTLSEFGKYQKIVDSNMIPIYKKLLIQDKCEGVQSEFFVLKNGQIKCINHTNYKDFDIDEINKYFNKKYKSINDIIYQNLYELIKENKENYKQEFEIFADIEELENQIEQVEQKMNIALTEQQKNNIITNLYSLMKEDAKDINNDIIKMLELDIDNYKIKYEMDLSRRMGEGFDTDLCMSEVAQNKYNKRKNEVNKIITSRVEIFNDIISTINVKYPSTKSDIMLYSIVQFISDYLDNYKPKCEFQPKCYVCLKKHEEEFKTVLFSEGGFETAYVCSEECLDKLKSSETAKKNITQNMIETLMNTLTKPNFDVKRFGSDMFRRSDLDEELLLNYLKYYKLILPKLNKETEYALRNLCDMFKINFKSSSYLDFLRTFTELQNNSDFWDIYSKTLKTPPEQLLNLDYANQFFLVKIFNSSVIKGTVNQAKILIPNHKEYTEEQLRDFLITSPYWFPDVNNITIFSSILYIYILNKLQIPANNKQIWSNLFLSSYIKDIINHMSRFPNKPKFDIPLTKLPGINTTTMYPLDPKNEEKFNKVGTKLYMVNDCIVNGSNIVDNVKKFAKKLYEQVIENKLKKNKNTLISREIVTDFYGESIDDIGCVVSGEELKKYNSNKRMLTGIMNTIKAMINNQKPPKVTLPKNFDELKIRKMISLHNNKLDTIEKEIKNMFELNTSSYLVNYDVFYSKMWSMVKYYLYVLNNDNINNIKSEKQKSVLIEMEGKGDKVAKVFKKGFLSKGLFQTDVNTKYDKVEQVKQVEVKKPKIVNPFGEEEEDEEETLTVEEVQDAFEKFMNSFSTLNIYFINIFVAYNKELRTLERDEQEEEDIIFYENIVPNEQPLVAGGEDGEDGEGGEGGDEGVEVVGGFEGDELV